MYLNQIKHLLQHQSEFNNQSSVSLYRKALSFPFSRIYKKARHFS